MFTLPVPLGAQGPRSRRPACCRRGDECIGGEVDPLRVTPQLFETVMLSNIGTENVGDHVAEIHQDPLRRRDSLDAHRCQPLAAQLGIDVVGDRLHLSFGLS